MSDKLVLTIVVCGAGPASHVDQAVGLAHERTPGGEPDLVAVQLSFEHRDLVAEAAGSRRAWHGRSSVAVAAA